MKHETSKLEGRELDLAVSKALGARSHAELFLTSGWFAPSTKWEHGGPIIERDRMAIMGDDDSGWFSGWQTSSDAEDDRDCFRRVAGECWQQGPTPLIAAMRAKVMATFGDEVELP